MIKSENGMSEENLQEFVIVPTATVDDLADMIKTVYGMHASEPRSAANIANDVCCPWPSRENEQKERMEGGVLEPSSIEKKGSPL